MPPLKRLSVVQEKGQVTIPTEIRKKLGLKKGDRVSFVETDRGVLISPQEVVALDALEKIGQLLKENGLT
ncbi:MAG: AbrB/MazE/SpoVT family DNA-binding domain-containing protein, partial [Chloroflexi bacterium]|nr:AbrB/MazE/SpoVT family DNA-binding domain-containing protein [Chloroflexota bacterium]